MVREDPAIATLGVGLSEVSFTITVHMASSNGREKVTWRVGDSWQTGQLKEY